MEHVLSLEKEAIASGESSTEHTYDLHNNINLAYVKMISAVWYRKAAGFWD